MTFLIALWGNAHALILLAAVATIPDANDLWRARIALERKYLGGAEEEEKK
jgi:hypothetical protein